MFNGLVYFSLAGDTMTRRDEKKQALRRLERKAKYLLMNKDIPISKIKIVRRLLKDDLLSKEERFNSVIDLLWDCKDRKDGDFKTSINKIEPIDTIITKIDKDEIGSLPIDVSPTETSYYIDSLFKKYQDQGFVKKRLLAKTDKGIGITLKKRLVPADRLISYIHSLGWLQKTMLSVLHPILNSILEDTFIDDPTIFNHLRLFEKWMRISPLLDQSSSSIKWMTRHDFEKEFRPLIVNYFSFYMVDSDIKKTIVSAVEKQIKILKIDLEIPESIKDITKNNDFLKLIHGIKEKKDQSLLELFTFFFPFKANKKKSIIEQYFEKYYNIPDLLSFFTIIIETLIYQRPIKSSKIVFPYFKIKEPKISNNAWDYHVSTLIKVGKDSNSLKRKELSNYQRELENYESIYQLINLEEDGHNLLSRAANEFWRIKTKQHHNVLQNNFILNLQCIMSFFKYAITPLLNGTYIEFMDSNRMSYDGTIFDASFFREDLAKFDILYNKLALLESNSYSNILDKNEIRKIMAGANPSMNHLQEYIRNVSDLFFLIGKELQLMIKQHQRWILKGKKLKSPDSIRTPHKKQKGEELDYNNPSPIPFSNHIIYSIKGGNQLTGRWNGRNIMEDSSKDGLIFYICSFCLQLANECFNKDIMYDLDRRMFFLKKISELELKTKSGSKRLQYA